MFCRNSNFYKMHRIGVHVGNTGMINKLLNTYNFEIKDTPHGSVISLLPEEGGQPPCQCLRPSAFPGDHPFAFFHEAL